MKAEAAGNAALFSTLDDAGWDLASLLMEHCWTLRFALDHIVHELVHHSGDIGRLTEPG